MSIMEKTDTSDFVISTVVHYGIYLNKLLWNYHISGAPFTNMV